MGLSKSGSRSFVPLIKTAVTLSKHGPLSGPNRSSIRAVTDVLSPSLWTGGLVQLLTCSSASTVGLYSSRKVKEPVFLFVCLVGFVNFIWIYCFLFEL